MINQKNSSKKYKISCKNFGKSLVLQQNLIRYYKKRANPLFCVLYNMHYFNILKFF